LSASNLMSNQSDALIGLLIVMLVLTLYGVDPAILTGCEANGR
jgi:hypothetical protein